jgi:hypothetical protein
MGGSDTRGQDTLGYRKEGIELDEDQQAFARLIEDYGSGVFRDSFATAHELQAKLVAKIRELEQARRTLALNQTYDIQIIRRAAMRVWPANRRPLLSLSIGVGLLGAGYHANSPNHVALPAI